MTTIAAHRPKDDRAPAPAYQMAADVTACDLLLDRALEDTFPASDPVSSNDCN